MIPEIGSTLIISAMLTSILQSIPAKKNAHKFSFISMFIALASFLLLIYAFIASDFSVSSVYLNSHTAKPFIYKITGSWGNHEGSMLLLAILIIIYGNAFYVFSNSGKKFKERVLNIQGMLAAIFLAFIFFTSNPFERIEPTPKNGLGLNPLLQDIGLAIHPPLLYIGYIGFSIVYAFAINIMREKNPSKNWIALLKPWVVFSWSFLTIGILMGSWWAYRELGWGGYWFWDPVENSSLMPWLSATALLHAVIVGFKRDILKSWIILLSILTFCLSITGFFLVRSGIVTSVHAFASDPTRGIFILAILLGLIVVALTIYALKGNKFLSTKNLKFFSREGFITLNNMILLCLLGTVIIGTVYPIILQVLNIDNITVGPDYYNKTFNTISLILLFIAALVPSLKWKNNKLKDILNKNLIPLIISLSSILAIYYFTEIKNNITIISLFFSLWIIITLFYIFIARVKKSYSRDFIAMATAHIGVAILVLGITISSEWQQEKQLTMKKNQTIEINQFNIKFDGITLLAKDNYLAKKGNFSIYEKDFIANLSPELRYYPIQNKVTTEAAIYYSIFSNIYIAIGEDDSAGNYAVRVYYKPFINLIWCGAILMALGGFLSIKTKRKK